MTSSNTSTTMPESQSDETELPAETHHTTSSQSNEIHSGVGVLDKTVKILDALESGPATLGQLVSSTGLARPTAHRLAIALERHRFVLRDQHGRFVLGSRFAELAAAAGEDRLLTAAAPILQTLLDRTGESAQIYRRQGDMRVCIAAVERASGLRDSIPLVRCCRWRPVPRPDFAGLEDSERCIRGCVTPSSPRPSLPPCASAVGPSRSTSAMRAYARFPRRFAMLPVR